MNTVQRDMTMIIKLQAQVIDELQQEIACLESYNDNLIAERDRDETWWEQLDNDIQAIQEFLKRLDESGYGWRTNVISQLSQLRAQYSTNRKWPNAVIYTREDNERIDNNGNYDDDIPF